MAKSPKHIVTNPVPSVAEMGRRLGIPLRRIDQIRKIMHSPMSRGKKVR
jgi:hypothetical protein